MAREELLNESWREVVGEVAGVALEVDGDVEDGEDVVNVEEIMTGDANEVKLEGKMA